MKTRWIIGVLLVAVFWLAPGMVPAVYGHGGDASLIHACVQQGSLQVRIVGPNEACRGPETAVHWSITGPQGPKGDKGDKGDQGSQGLRGTPGTNGIDGTSVTFVDYFSGNLYGCPNGGEIYAAAGNPPVNTYICNGTNGTNGIDGKDGTNATRADGPCFDNSNRYVNCMNGTVTDTVTGLIWLRQADCLPNADYSAANQAAAGLKDGDCGGALTDKSSPGDWRLPTKDEWSATIARASALGCRVGGTGGPPSLTNDAGKTCFGDGTGSSFPGVTSGNYWSSSTNDISPQIAWFANLVTGIIEYLGSRPNGTLRVWPVRGGSCCLSR